MMAGTTITARMLSSFSIVVGFMVVLEAATSGLSSSVAVEIGKFRPARLLYGQN